MIQFGRNEPKDCSASAGLRLHSEHVWCPNNAAMDLQALELARKTYLIEMRGRSLCALRHTDVALDIEPIIIKVNALFLGPAAD
jgi:hypothetical protein